MYALIDSVGKLTDVREVVDYQTLVADGYNIVECSAEATKDVGKVFSNGLYSAPTPFHVAQAGMWTLPERNRQHLINWVLKEVENVPRSQKARIISMCQRNPTKAYYLLGHQDDD